jgi:hypothetical protein
MKNEGKKWRRGVVVKFIIVEEEEMIKKIETSGERRSLTELWDEKR